MSRTILKACTNLLSPDNATCLQCRDRRPIVTTQKRARRAGVLLLLSSSAISIDAENPDSTESLCVNQSPSILALV